MRRTIIRVFGHNLLVVLALATALMFGLTTQADESFARPAVVDSAAALVEAHDCGGHVADPTHVVVTVDGMTRYSGQRMTDRAIEQAVFGVEHGLIVHGFCA